MKETNTFGKKKGFVNFEEIEKDNKKVSSGFSEIEEDKKNAKKRVDIASRLLLLRDEIKRLVEIGCVDGFA